MTELSALERLSLSHKFRAVSAKEMLMRENNRLDIIGKLLLAQWRNCVGIRDDRPKE